MLARLSSSDYPALAPLKTRSDDDFTIALLDATSVMLDILTFYQERLANESYLRTAVQLRSLTELSRLINYQPAPGVSASTHLAFNLKTAPGQPADPSTPAITIPVGSQVQSVPAQGQKPQTFETSVAIQAKPDWNSLAVATGQSWIPKAGHTSIYLDGTTTQLQPGDLILIVGDERVGSPDNTNWDVRLVTTVEPDNLKKRTYVEWSRGLGDTPAQLHPRFYVFRQRAALFGYNAMNPRLLSATIKISDLLTEGEWDFAGLDLSGSGLIDLDNVYPKIVPGGWIALVVPTPVASTHGPPFIISPAVGGRAGGFDVPGLSVANPVDLYRIESATTISRSDFGLSVKISRARTDTNAKLSDYYNKTRSASALVQSEELTITEQPFDYPLYGSIIDLEELRTDLAGITVVAITGTRQRVVIRDGAISVLFVPDDPNSQPLTLHPGEILILTSAAPLPLNEDLSIPDWVSSADQRTLRAETSQGQPGTVRAALNLFALVPSAASDPQVSEVALVASIRTASTPRPHTRIWLQSNPLQPGLINCYDRTTTTVNTNVVLATHGQSVSEIMGGGNESTRNQRFKLKQSPVTYVPAPTSTGRRSTLEVRASGVAWKEVPSLYRQEPSAPVFATLNQSDGTTEVIFGDGVEGAMLSTGQNNILASYRIGSESQGNVASGVLTTLMDRPLGVSSVTNPAPATGGQDAESVDDVRFNAPQTVSTLGRAVSITDYQNYAATFAGIAKAQAIWIHSGPGRGVFLTVAGASGGPLPPGSLTLNNLVVSLHNSGNPLIPITVQSFLETLFGLSADVAYDPAFDRTAVEAQVRQTLLETYSFARRTFGQGVSADEVSAIIQDVRGVTAVNVKEIRLIATSAAGDLAAAGVTVSSSNAWMAKQVPQSLLPRSKSSTRICPYLPVANTHSLPQPAEILVLHPDPKQVRLGVLS
jgi:hypothetical protein